MRRGDTIDGGGKIESWERASAPTDSARGLVDGEVDMLLMWLGVTSDSEEDQGHV